jgi:hypothetical protein
MPRQNAYFYYCAARRPAAAEDKVQIMETKGRRAPRAAGPIGAPEPGKPVEAPLTAEGPIEAPSEPPTPPEILAEAVKPAEAVLDFAAGAATSAPQPGVAAIAKAAKSPSADDLAHLGRDALAALAQSQSALARGLEALSVEMAGLALSGIDTAARTATKMLGVKTLTDAIQVNAGFTCSSLDTLVGGSAKLSELSVKLAAETSQPILTQFGKGWIKASRFGS